MKNKALYEALYRARATMAEGSHLASEWSGAAKSSGILMGLQQIDRAMQNGVEDLDQVLIDYEQVNIFDLAVCPRCGVVELLEGEKPFHCGMQMEKVKVERIN